MSKSKEHKYELGKSRPTENAALNSIVESQVQEWVKKIREAGKVGDGGVRGSINDTAYILLDLIRETKEGKYPREVISKVVKRCNVEASLRIAIERTTHGV